MAYFIDTNVLLRIAQTAHPAHGGAAAAVSKLTALGEELYISPQTVREFWNVATRPTAKNGLGLSISHVEAEVQRIELAFTVLADGIAVYQEWRRLVVAHRVSGVQVHDANIAAVMKVHGITNLLTFNGPDFSRYGLNVVDPANV